MTAVLDLVDQLGDAFQDVLQHLSARERQHLHSTCRSLRHNTRLLYSITEVRCERGVNPIRAGDLAYLRKLNLESLRFRGLPSLLNLHKLSVLPALTELTLADGRVCNLRSLSCLTGLRQLGLVDIEQRVNLDSLTQFSQLWFYRARSTSALARLTSLQSLSLVDDSHLGSLSQLPRLTHLALLRDCETMFWEPSDISQALQTIAALPGLRVLKTAFGHLEAVSLTQLTALYLVDPPWVLEAGLTVLTSLRRLGLSSWAGSTRISAPGITSVFLRYCGQDEIYLLPDLAACSALQHILIRFGEDCDMVTVLLRSRQAACCAEVEAVCAAGFGG